MSDKSAKLLTLYQALIDRVKALYEQDHSLTTKDLLKSVTNCGEYIKLKQAAGAEEMALVEHFLKRDIVTFLSERNANDLSFSPSVITAENTLWHWLNEITDRSQVEWHELNRDLHNQGQYHSGEIVSQGRLICTKCGNSMDIEFPGVIPDCPECDNGDFTREPLEP